MHAPIHTPSPGLKRRRRLLPTCAAALLSLAIGGTAQATQLVPQNLTQLINKADVIVAGQVTSVKDGIANGVPYTEVTMKVSGSAKKELADSSVYTFRQFGLLKPRRLDDGRYLMPAKIEGMATWVVGERVMTFMNRPSAVTGLTSPVGMAQGKLTLHGSTAANSFNNVGLFDGVQVTPSLLKTREAAMLNQTSGAVELSVLQGLVKRAVTNNWVSSGAMK